MLDEIKREKFNQFLEPLITSMRDFIDVYESMKNAENKLDALNDKLKSEMNCEKECEEDYN